MSALLAILYLQGCKSFLDNNYCVIINCALAGTGTLQRSRIKTIALHSLRYNHLYSPFSEKYLIFSKMLPLMPSLS